MSGGRPAAFLVLVCVLALAKGDDDGQYRPERYKGDDGKYKPDNQGKYVPNGDSGNDGRYVRDENDGRYIKDDSNESPNAASSNLDARTSLSGGGGFRNLLSNPSHVVASNDYFINRFIADEASSSNIAPNSQPPAVPITNLVGPSIIQTKQYSVPDMEFDIVAPQTKQNNQQAQPDRSNQQSQPNSSPRSGGSGVNSGPDGRSRILRQDVDIGPDGYHYLYETENSIVAEEDGRLISQDSGGRDAIAATGFYEYVGPDNVKYRIDYIADENGFQPLGLHIPTPPPIPIEIQRILVEKENK